MYAVWFTGRYQRLREEQRMGFNRTPGDAQYKILLVLQGALSGSDFHCQIETDRSFLQLHSRSALRFAVLSHVGHILATAGIAGQNTARQVAHMESKLIFYAMTQQFRKPA